MNNNIKRSQNGFTLDTCVGIKICENPNVGNLLNCRVNFENSSIHLNSQTIFEAEKLGHDIDHISKQIQSTVGGGVNVIRGYVTSSMRDDAVYLESVCPTLHAGDSQILAYARATGTTLITCDKDLAEAAGLSGVVAINPDLLPCDALAKKTPKSRFHRIVKKAAAKPVVAKHKVMSTLSVKPGQKILWRSFN